MKTFLSGLVTLVVVLASFQSYAGTSKLQNYSFQYKVPQYKSFTITRTAGSKEEAFRLAARDCFKQLTGNKYPGEEKGLEIIDICANPKL